jgi:hypothetical protein
MIRKGCRWSQASGAMASRCSGEATRCRQTRNTEEDDRHTLAPLQQTLLCKKKERKIILSIKNFGRTSPARGGFEYLQKTTARWPTFTYDSSMADIHIQRLDGRYSHTTARYPKTTYNDNTYNKNYYWHDYFMYCTNCIEKEWANLVCARRRCLGFKQRYCDNTYGDVWVLNNVRHNFLETFLIFYHSLHMRYHDILTIFVIFGLRLYLIEFKNKSPASRWPCFVNTMFKISGAFLDSAS